MLEAAIARSSGAAHLPPEQRAWNQMVSDGTALLHAAYEQCHAKYHRNAA